MTWTSTTYDALVQIDDAPTWVRVSAVEAITPDAYPNDHRTRIHLAGGASVVTDVLADEVIGKLRRAGRNTL